MHQLTAAIDEEIHPEMLSQRSRKRPILFGALQPSDEITELANRFRDTPRTIEDALLLLRDIVRPESATRRRATP
jgi:hypothetical protein